jgi:glyoxylase-like metal-dependent hydrolase (beta-lactamase superfamily II)
MQKLQDIVESNFPGVTVGAILTSDGIICIDTPTHPADARRWRLKLAQLSQKPVLFVVNLDHHRDRVLGNQWFEAPVVAHASTHERVRVLPELFKGGLTDAGADGLATDLAGVPSSSPQLAHRRLARQRRARNPSSTARLCARRSLVDPQVDRSRATR